MTTPATDHRSRAWPAAPCPDWCARLHEDGEPPEDSFHHSIATLVPATLVSSDTRSRAAGLREQDVALTLSRNARDVAEWVTIEPTGVTGPHLALTVESARGLADDLARLLRGRSPGHD